MAIRNVEWLLCMGVLCGLSACSSLPERGPAPATLLQDALFSPPIVPVDASAAFTLSSAMQQYAETVLRPALQRDLPERALVEALYDAGQLQLEYDAERTRTAAEAFDARLGNCLSLVMMTGAFARYFDLPVQYREVFTAPSWSRTEGLELANRHVNLAFSRQTSQPLVVVNGLQREEAMVVDFMPRPQATQQRARPIGEEIVSAMYLNNRAAEYLAQQRPDEAYWWVREAIRTVPKFTDSYNSLGVIYQMKGRLAEAEQSLRHAIALEPDNAIPLSNLVEVLRDRGTHAEAALQAARLARIEPYPPFHFFDLGLAALQRGETQLALGYLKREVNRMAYQPEAHFWLGIAHLRLGEMRQAKVHLGKAVENSTTQRSRTLYTAKLDWLKSQGYSPRRRG